MSEPIVKGIYRDVLRDELGRAVFDSGWKSNTIVFQCRQLLAALMKGDAADAPLGINSFKIGMGNSDWDKITPPPIDPKTTQLEDKNVWTIPRDNLTLQYLDERNQISKAPTNKLEIVTTLGPNQPPSPDYPSPYPLREFGLFGKIKDQEYMIDYVRHMLIEKDSAVTLERRVHLIF